MPSTLYHAAAGRGRRVRQDSHAVLPAQWTRCRWLEPATGAQASPERGGRSPHAIAPDNRFEIDPAALNVIRLHSASSLTAATETHDGCEPTGWARMRHFASRSGFQGLTIAAKAVELDGADRDCGRRHL